MRAWLGQHRTEMLLALIVVVGSGYFYHGATWNQLSRYNAIFAFVEPGPHRGTFQIDAFVPDPLTGINTGDWASNPDHDRHAYSNKAPGPMLLGIPAYAALYLGERTLGLEPRSPLLTYINAWLLNFWISILPLAIALPLLFHLLQRLLPSRRLALVYTVGFYAGSLVWPFSTALWGHVTATACLIAALYFLHRATGRPTAGAWCGFFAGAAVLMEYSAALTVVLVGAYLLGLRAWRTLGFYLLGGLAPLAIYLAYHWWCFGSPLTTASFHNNPLYLDDGKALGIFGMAFAEPLWGLTFSPYRGLFWYMPWAGLAVAGCGWLRWRRDHAFHWLCLANAIAYFALNLTFNGWPGGASAGPRYLIPALPFAVVLAALLPWADWRRRPAIHLRVSLAAALLVAISFANMLTIAATSTIPDEESKRPLALAYRYLWINGDYPKRLAPQRLHPWTAPRNGYERAIIDLVRRYGQFNLGELAGLGNRTALLPWAIVVGALLWALYRAESRDRVDNATGNLIV